MGVVVRHQANGELRFRTLNRSVMEMQQQEYAVVLDVPNWPDGKVDVYMVASYAEASEQSYSSINVTLFSMNQGPLETAYMVKTLAKPVPNSFKFDYKVVNDFANEYRLLKEHGRKPDSQYSLSLIRLVLSSVVWVSLYLLLRSEKCCHRESRIHSTLNHLLVYRLLKITM